MIKPGILAFDVPALMASATRRIVWHASIYSPFARSDRHGEAVRDFLRRPGGCGMDIVTLPRRPEAWCTCFFTVLRGGSVRSAGTELETSWRFLDELSSEFPSQVRIHVLKRRPSLPILLIDDNILFGHYAVSSVPAGQGWWTRVEADVERMLSWMPHGPPESVTDWERACYRVVSDCANAMSDGGIDEGDW